MEDNKPDPKGYDEFSRIIGSEINLTDFPNSESIEKGRRVSKGKPPGYRQFRIPNEKNEWFFHRTHLIAFKFVGKRAILGEKGEFFTGTRYLNVSKDEKDESMSTYENIVEDWLMGCGVYKVHYKVDTEYANDADVIPRGVRMRATAFDESGNELPDKKFDVSIRNIYPGYEICYKTGKIKQIRK